MAIEVIVAVNGEEKTPVFSFPTTDAAAGFIADLFEKQGDVAVAVSVDGVPVEWAFDDGVLTIDGQLETPRIH